MLAGRAVVEAVVWVMDRFLGFARLNPFHFVQGSIVTGVPGIVFQLSLIPLLVRYLERRIKAE